MTFPEIKIAVFVFLLGFTLSIEGHSFADSVRLKSKRQTARSDSTGRYLEINRIFIIGNKITRDQIILRELTLKTGDVIYNADLHEVLDQDERKLFNLHLFNTVDIRTLELEDGKVDLLVNLNERWYTFPSPIFELSDRNFNEWWENYDHDFDRVNYGLRLYQFNMRGRNETLRLTAQFGFQRVFNLTYRIPYIDKRQKHGLVFDVEYQETKNLAYRTFDHKLDFLRTRDLLRVTRATGITYTYRNSFYDFHAVKLEYRNTAINDTVALLNPNFFGDEKASQRYTSLSYRFTSEHRDVIAYPLKGSYFTVYLQKHGLSDKEDVNKFDATMSYAKFFDLKKGYYLSNYSSVYGSFPREQPFNMYGGLGYKKQFVRGYEVYVIEGQHYAFNKTTFKKLLFSRVYNWKKWPIEQFRHVPVAVYLKTYADIGYVEAYPNYVNNTRLTNSFLASAGAGIDLVTFYDAVLRFEYTFNKEGQRGFFFHILKEF